MRRSVWSGTGMLAALLLFGAAPNARAQVFVGPHAGYNTDVEEAFIGGSVLLELPAQIGSSKLVFNPSFELYPFIGNDVVDISLWALNADVLYAFQAPSLVPYVGAGLQISRVSLDVSGLGSASDTDVGLNLKGGARFGTGRIQPFGEGVVTVADQTAFLLRGGIYFALGPGS